MRYKGKYLFRRETKISERNRFLRSEVHINQNGRACMERHQPHILVALARANGRLAITVFHTRGTH